MKKMLFSLIAITMLSTGTTLAQRRSSNHHDTPRTESFSHRGGSSHHDNYARDYNRGHRGGPVHHEVIHHRPPVHHVYHRPHHMYYERVVVAPVPPVAYHHPCPPPPPPAPVVVVETAPVPAAISIGALAGAIIGGTIAAATR